MLNRPQFFEFADYKIRNHDDEGFPYSYSGIIFLQFAWNIIHLLASMSYVFWDIIYLFQSYLISSGLLKKYKSLNINQIHHLAIVIESEEAHNTSRVIELLRWLTTLGVNSICLYDMDGVLKKSKDIILTELDDASLFELEAEKKKPLHEQKQRIVEFASLSDGKEGITRAANYLCSHDVKIANGTLVFTEANMSQALKACGYVGLDPNLLIVYGPARCHLGFPPWRLRYTEIVHMGPLKSMRYGALVKAIYQFLKVRQNHGT
ncbi:hypothetical protein Sjap_002253 [Stephania japonica]|uniref:ditrans,polycis-polyprenyl diphosphate synthase [(2E,6E)-farnesyldiphosphate specific] n=1 Tax=Stephania japonica TaxID=461633 RepID=A0AAP0KN57_9MAGN